MKHAPEDLEVGRAPREEVPHDHAHPPVPPFLSLFIDNHTENGAASKSQFLDQPCHTEDESPDTVVFLDSPADRQVVTLEIRCGDSLKDGS